MTWVVVPVKRFSLGKSRLASVLGERERKRFATRLFDHAIESVLAVDGLSGVLVVTDCAEVEVRAHAAGADAIVDEAASTIGEAVRIGLGRVTDRGAARALVLMTDLPLLHPSDVVAMLAALETGDVAVAPDTRDVGTNALALRTPLAMDTLFGTGDSFPRHLAEARRKGLREAIVRAPGLLFDVDTPDDYRRFLALSGCREAVIG